MAKKTKEEGIIVNQATENPVDVILRDQDSIEDDLHVKTLEAESKTKLQDEKSEGEPITLRFFDFAISPEKFQERKVKGLGIPTPQELFNAHVKQIELELWKDEWQPIPEIEPRLMFSKDGTHYRIVVGARPAKGSNLSLNDIPHSLSDIASSYGRSKNS